MPSLVGAHAPSPGGLAKSASPYAAAVAAETIQVLVTNPRGWAPSKGPPAQDAAFRAAVANSIPVFAHASLLINLASPDPLGATRSGLLSSPSAGWKVGDLAHRRHQLDIPVLAWGSVGQHRRDTRGTSRSKQWS